VRHLCGSGGGRIAWLALHVAAALLVPTGALLAQTTETPGDRVPAAASVQALAWLQGCWQAGSTERPVEEVWMAPRGGVMVGMGRSLRADGSAGWEHLLLSVREGRLTYSALPSGQALTHFPATELGPGRVRFENPDHDVPQALLYRRVSADAVVASVYGSVADSEPAFRLRYARVACPS